MIFLGMALMVGGGAVLGELLRRYVRRRADHVPRATKLLPEAKHERRCCCTETYETAQLYRYGDRWSTTVCAHCGLPLRDRVVDEPIRMPTPGPGVSRG